MITTISEVLDNPKIKTLLKDLVDDLKFLVEDQGLKLTPFKIFESHSTSISPPIPSKKQILKIFTNADVCIANITLEWYIKVETNGDENKRFLRLLIKSKLELNSTNKKDKFEFIKMLATAPIEIFDTLIIGASLKENRLHSLEIKDNREYRVVYPEYSRIFIFEDFKKHFNNLLNTHIVKNELVIEEKSILIKKLINTIVELIEP